MKLPNLLRLPLHIAPFYIFVQTVIKLLISLKKGHPIHHLTNNHLFPHSHSALHCANDWQFSSGHADAEWYCTLIEPIRSFRAIHGSRHDSKTSWLFDIGTLTYPMATIILSQKTKKSVLETEWDRPSGDVCLRIWAVFDNTEQDKDRTRQGRTGRMITGEAAFLGFSPSDILVDRTRVSALYICPIS